MLSGKIRINFRQFSAGNFRSHNPTTVSQHELLNVRQKKPAVSIESEWQRLREDISRGAGQR